MPLAPAEPTDIYVVFATSFEVARGLGQPALVIVPEQNSWNDYGHKLYAQLFVHVSDDYVQLPIAISFESETNTYAYLTTLLKDQGPVIAAGEVDKRFVSLLKDAVSYGRLVEMLGFDAAIQGLRRLNDVVLGRLEGDAALIAQSDSHAFWVGMARNAPNYVSLRRGSRFLRRLPAVPVEDAAASFHVVADLPSSSAPVAVAFDFEPDAMFKDRCCVLIGRNGIGKTQLLRSMITGLLPEGGLEEASDLDGPAASFDPKPRFHRLMVFSSVPSDPYPVSIPPWSGLDYEYHPLIADDRPLGSAFMGAVVDSLRDDGMSFGSATPGRRRANLLADLLEKLGLWDRLCVPLRPDRLDEFSPTYIEGAPHIFVSAGFNEIRLSLLTYAIDWGRPAVVLDEAMRRRRLSSGELAMATFVARAVAAIETGSLLLFDEPETHLHPNYVSEFMDILQSLLARTKSIAVIATHSAYVVREAPRQRVSILQAGPTNDPSERVVVEVAEPRMQTFGASIDDLSRFVFADGLISHRYQTVLADWVRRQGSALRVEDVLAEHGSTLNPETLSFIARLIRDRVA